jgi:hypothetical protein
LLTDRRDPFGGLDGPGRDLLLAAAERHGLLSTLAGRLPPGDNRLCTRYQRLAAGARLRDARVRSVLEEVLSLLARAGVVPIALKGPVLADRVYPDPALRYSGDLDLLVPASELERSVEALQAAGFGRAPALVDAYQRRHLHHLHLHRPPDPDVELHFKAQSAFGVALPAAELLARTLPHRTPQGTALLVLSPEDELLTLAVHAAGHLLERASWLLDLLLFLDRHPALDWSVVAARAAEYRCRRALAYALVPVRELGGPVPEGPLLALGPRRRALCSRLAAAALARQGRAGIALRFAHELALRDRPFRSAGRILAEAWWFVRRRADFVVRRTLRGGRRGPGQGKR